MGVWPASVYHMVPGAHGGQKRNHTLELELQTAVNCHVNAGNETWVLWKSTQCPS